MLVSHFGEFRLQDKWDKKLSSAHKGDSLPRSQTELRSISSVSVRGAHQVNSWLSIPFSEREQCHSIGAVAREFHNLTVWVRITSLEFVTLTYTYQVGETPWSRRWFTPGKARPLHSGRADPCKFPKCGNLDCIIYDSGGLRSRSPLKVFLGQLWPNG